MQADPKRAVPAGAAPVLHQRAQGGVQAGAQAVLHQGAQAGVPAGRQAGVPQRAKAGVQERAQAGVQAGAQGDLHTLLPVPCVRKCPANLRKVGSNKCYLLPI